MAAGAMRNEDGEEPSMANKYDGISLRKAAHKIGNFLFDHLISATLAAILAAVSIVLIFLKGWLLATHTLAMPGLLWVLCLILYPVFFIVGLSWAAYGPMKFKDQTDIKNRLSIYLRKVQPNMPGTVEYTLHYRSLDRHYRLKRGSARKYLAQVAQEHGWKVVDGGPETLRVRYRVELSIGL